MVALSEGLRLDWRRAASASRCCARASSAPRSSIRRRNLPERFAGKIGRPPATGPIAERVKSIRDRVAQGIDPLYVGELVREGIENDWPYIFTDNEFEPFIEHASPPSRRASTGFADVSRGVERVRSNS